MRWAGWGGHRHLRLNGVRAHGTCLTQAQHTFTQLRGRKMVAQWIWLFFVWADLCWFQVRLWVHLKKKKKKMLHFIELPSVQCLRAVRGGKKYLQWYYSSLAVCMSACYPRLGQNTPLVQTREKRKKKKRESNKKAKHNSSTSQSWHRRPTTRHSHSANTNWPCSNNIKRKG